MPTGPCAGRGCPIRGSGDGAAVPVVIMEAVAGPVVAAALGRAAEVQLSHSDHGGHSPEGLLPSPNYGLVRGAVQ
jgi:hypothetical protein